MAGFRKLVDMRLAPPKAAGLLGDPVPAMPDYPYGLRISLTEDDLEKLDLSDDAEVGDTLHLVAMAEVTSVNRGETGMGKTTRVELVLCKLAVENESTEAANAA